MTILYDDFPSDNDYGGFTYKGPFEDGNGNLYIISYEWVSLYASAIHAWKSTTSGSTWTEIASKSTSYGGNSNFGRIDANEDQIIIPVWYGVFNPNYSIYVYTFRTSSASSGQDTFSSTVYSTTAKGYGQYGDTIDVRPQATCQKDNNDFSIFYSDSVLASSSYYCRPKFGKIVSGAATWGQTLYSYSDSDTSNYFPIMSGLQLDGQTTFVWTHTSTNFAWKNASSSYSLGSLNTSSVYGYQGQYNYLPLLTIESGNMKFSWVHIYASTKNLVTISSGSVITTSSLPTFYFSDSDRRGYWYHSREYSGAYPDYLLLFEAGPSSWYYPPIIMYKTKLRDEASWSDWQQLQDTTSGSTNPSIIDDIFLYVTSIGDYVYWIENVLSSYPDQSILHRVPYPSWQLSPAIAGADSINPTVSALCTVGLPISDHYSSDIWIADDDLSTNLWDHLDEYMPENGTWIYSTVTSGSSTIYRAKLTSMTTSGSDTSNYKVCYSYFLMKDPSDIASYPDLTVRLVQMNTDGSGRSVIAEWSHTDITSETPTDVEQSVTALQVTSITDWTKLYIEYEVIDT